MKNTNRIVLIALPLLCILLSGCGLYGKYKPTETLTDTVAVPTYQEVFAGNAELLDLINTALTNNLDMKIAHEHVVQAEASLLGAKLAYLPQIYAGGAPVGQAQFTTSATQGYSHTFATASWELDIFGRTTNLKRMAQATLEEQKNYEQAARTQLIASVAETYFNILMLDAQIVTADSAVLTWKESVETLRQMKEAGMSDEAAVAQFQASYESTRALACDLRLSRLKYEHALSLLLSTDQTPTITTSLDQATVAYEAIQQIDLRALRCRPDVKASEHQLEYAFYGKNYANANCCPSISISGTVGWASGGLLFSAIGNLLQPIFNAGKNISEVRIAQSRVREYQAAFSNTLFQAGTEVNDALATAAIVREQAPYYKGQVTALESAFDATTTKMHLGKGTYLEVLTAQNNLLTARISLIQNQAKLLLSSVQLYHALGGGI